MKPLRACEVLQNMEQYANKTVLVLGRFSFRENGRFLGEKACTQELKRGDFTWPSVMRVLFDSDAGPKAPEPLAIDAPAVYQLLSVLKQTTSLTRFRFGTSSYDRWALIYGKLQPTPEFSKSVRPDTRAAKEFEPAPAQIVCRSNAMVIFLADQ